LENEINAAGQTITLIYGGANISGEEIKNLEKNLPIFKLEGTVLDIQIGFGNKEDDEINPLATELLSKEQQLQEIESELELKNNSLDSIVSLNLLSKKIFKELKAQYNTITTLTMQPSIEYSDSSSIKVWLVRIEQDSLLLKEDQDRIEAWLKERVENNNLHIQYDVNTPMFFQPFRRFLNQ